MENRFPLNEQLSQTLKSYLQRRNYPAVTQLREINETQMILNATVQNETSRNNSIAFSSFSSDPMIIEHTFSKFVQWINDIVHKCSDHQDLHKIVAPLFCHFFIELHQKVQKDKESMELLQKSTSHFFKFHLPSVEKLNSDDTITKLLKILQGQSDSSNLKEAFRSNKYCVNLCSKSVRALKKYLAESSHVILLQIIQMWFNIREEEDPECEESVTDSKMDVEHEVEHLKDVIALINTGPPPIYSVNLGNLKGDATAGCVDNNLGMCAYSYDNMIFLSSIETLKQLPNTDSVGDVIFYEHSGSIYDMKMLSNVLLTASQDKTIKLFNLTDYQLHTTYQAHEYPVYCLSPSSCGSVFVSGSYDHTCRLWSYESKYPLRLYAGHTQEITSVQFHPNGKYFVSGSSDKAIRMWTMEDSCPVRLLLGSTGTIYASAFSEDGKMLATAGDDKSIRIWDLTKGQQIYEIKTPDVVLITHLLWCSNDTIVCSGSSNGLIQFWDVKDVWQKTEECAVISTQEMNKKLLDLVSFRGTISCLTAESAGSTTMLPM